MELIFRHTWILFIVVTFVNAFSFKKRFRKYIDLNPDLQEGYDKLIRNFLIFGNIPWVIMAIGDLTGMTTSTFDFFDPRHSPITLLFHISIIVIWIIGSYWIYFNNGAEFLVKHPGFFNANRSGGADNITENKIKLFWGLVMIGGIVGEITMWNNLILPKPIVRTDHSPLVYDFANRLPRLNMLLPLLFVAIGVGIYLYNKKSGNKNAVTGLGINNRRFSMLFGLAFASIAGLISIVLIPATLGSYFKTKSIYEKKQYQTIEGEVEHFHPMPAGGHDSERFTVNEIPFEFSDFDISDYGYNNAASHGGAIKEGIRVRITYFNNGHKNVILKLEMLP